VYVVELKKTVSTKPFIVCECTLSSDVNKIHLDCNEVMKHKPVEFAQVPCWKCMPDQHENLKKKVYKRWIRDKRWYASKRIL